MTKHIEVTREVSWETPIEKTPFIYKRQFMIMEHNYLCAVCKQNSGVQNTHSGVLQPCWDCQKRGFVLVKKNWFTKLFLKEYMK